MTKREFFWLAQVIAVISYNYVDKDLQESMLDYIIERLEIKYPRFDPVKFRVEYRKQYQMLMPKAK